MTMSARLMTTFAVALAVFPSALAASPSMPRVEGGTGVEPGELPFMIEIEGRLSSTAEWEHLCGATLIQPGVVMTAAHCIVDPPTGEPYPGLESRLVFGRVDRAEAPERIVHQTRYQPVIHSLRDLAVLILDHDIEDVPVVHLPAAGVFPVPGSKAMLAGWGYTEQDVLPGHLRRATVDIIDPARCNTPHRPASVADVPRLCTWSPDAGARSGDSGGPLLQRAEDGRGYLQVGVVSGGRVGYPNAYVNLAEPALWDGFDAPLDWPPAR